MKESSVMCHSEAFMNLERLLLGWQSLPGLAESVSSGLQLPQIHSCIKDFHGTESGPDLYASLSYISYLMIKRFECWIKT